MTLIIIGTVFVILFFVLPIGLILCMLYFAAKQDTRHVNTCRKCGYDLRFVTHRRDCPECGQPFMVNAKGDAVS